jgi:hypothetical protein
MLINLKTKDFVDFQVTIPHAPPTKVWDFMADFRNAMILLFQISHF